MLVAPGSSQLAWSLSRALALLAGRLAPRSQPLGLNRWQLHSPAVGRAEDRGQTCSPTSPSSRRDDREVRGVDRARLGAPHEGSRYR